MFSFLEESNPKCPSEIIFADHSSILEDQEDIDMDDIEVLNEEVVQNINEKLYSKLQPDEEGGEENHPFLKLGTVLK